VVADHFFRELLHFLRLGFFLRELGDLDFIAAGAVNQRGDFLIGFTSLTLLSGLLPLSKLALLADSLSLLTELVCLARLTGLPRLIELILTRLTRLDGLALLAGSYLARLILTCWGLLVLLRRRVLAKTYAASTQSHHESDKHLTHRKAPEKWTSRTPRLGRSCVRN
jgi:hypothetical protein